MPSPVRLLALAAAIASSATATFQGFNYGALFTDDTPKTQSDFEAEFKAAASLAGTNGGFTSARLFTMIQGKTTNDPISAIPAAISTKTSLLFGLWASGGDDAFNNELAAVRKVADQYCSQLNGLVAGFSVGSEDLYRISPIGMQTGSNPGVGPDTLVRYISKLRDTLKGTCFANIPVGHVDTWTVYVNATNKPVIDAVDWLGMDAYPYFEFQRANALSNGRSLFESALQQTQAAAGSKPIWITETGWPVSGKDSGAAVASAPNAKVYWDEVGCPRFGKTNIWWYTLQDSAPGTPNPSFGVVGPQLSNTPLYDLSCSNTSSSSSSGSSSGSSSATAGSSPSAASSANGGPRTANPIAAAAAAAAAGAATSGPASGASPSGAYGGVGNGNVPSASRVLPATSTGLVPPAAGAASNSTGAAGASGSRASNSATQVTVSSASRAHSFAAAAFAAVLAAAAML